MNIEDEEKEKPTEKIIEKKDPKSEPQKLLSKKRLKNKVIIII